MKNAAPRARRPRKPTYDKLLAALGTLLSEYGEIDEMLDSFMENTLEVTEAEKRRQRRSNRTYLRISTMYRKLIENP
jgi:hypothetical protein